MNDEITIEELKIKNYVNNTEACRIGNVPLTFTDVVSATVLGGLPTLMIGHSEKGKTFLASQINNQYFGGRGKLIQAASLDENSELFTQTFKKPDMERGEFVIDEEALQSPMMFMDEVGAIPKPLQAQFYPVGDGYIPHKGNKHPLGLPQQNKRYHYLLASTNTIHANGNGSDYGNFGITKASASRFRVCLDLTRGYRRDTQSLISIALQEELHLKYGDEVSEKDITEKIVKVNEEIIKRAENPSLEEMIALDFLQLGTMHCVKGPRYEDDWMDQCFNCDKKINCPAKHLYMGEMMRTRTTIKVLANALVFVAQLKQDFPLSSEQLYDCVFEATKFVLPGKYGLLNTQLQTEERTNEHDFIQKGLQEIKQHWKEQVEPYVTCAINIVRDEGVVPTQFAQINNVLLPVCKQVIKKISRQNNWDAKNLLEIMTLTEVQEPFSTKSFFDVTWIPELLKEKIKQDCKTGV